MNRTLIAILATLVLLLLPATLPAALAQDEKLNLDPVPAFNFTSDTALAWTAPTVTAHGGLQGYDLWVRYLIKGSDGNDYRYVTSQEPSASATSATVSYDTSRGSFHCALSGIRPVASATHYNEGTWVYAWRGCEDFDWGSALNGEESGGSQRAFSTLATPTLVKDPSAPRRNPLGLPSIRDGMMLSFDGRLNPHAGAPVAAFAGAGSLKFWHVLANSKGILIGSIPDVNALLQAGHAGGELLRATHPESGKTVTVTYRPGFRMLEVSTFYADSPHQQNKLYTICIMADNNVEVVLW